MSTTGSTEPEDSHTYRWLDFERDSVEFFVRALAFCQGLIEGDLQAVKADPQLSAVFDSDQRARRPVDRFLRTVKLTTERLEEALKSKRELEHEVTLDISHGSVRLIKSAALLYGSHLRTRRDALARRPNVSSHVLGVLDQKLRQLEEATNVGVFAYATPLPMLADQVIVPAKVPNTEPDRLMTAPSPRPVVLNSVEVLDQALRERCLDLLEQFREGGQQERLIPS